MQTMKLIIEYPGDPSVGLWATSWEVECPFERSEHDAETLEWFRQKQLELYSELADQRVHARYDFEIMENEESERKFEEAMAKIEEQKG